MIRLWRARRRRDRIEAQLRADGNDWMLEMSRNERTLVAWTFKTADDARAEANRRLRDLERAGWISHW